MSGIESSPLKLDTESVVQQNFQGETPWTIKSRIPRRETPDASPGVKAAKRAIRAARLTDSLSVADAVCRI